MLIIASKFVCYKSFFVVPRIKTHIISNHKHVAVTTFVVHKSLTTNINWCHESKMLVILKIVNISSLRHLDTPCVGLITNTKTVSLKTQIMIIK